MQGVRCFTLTFKRLCKDPAQVLVGGVAASVVPDELHKETGIRPFVGLLDRAGILDDNDLVVEEMPLDYSILYESDYVYPENDGYYSYMTRGCVNKCAFCAVPTLEPKYCNYISISDKIYDIDARFGQKRHLLLLDNNVLASDHFGEIIDEIKACGFVKGAKYVPPDEYEVSVRGLRSGYNDRGYVRHILGLYKLLVRRSPPGKQVEVYGKLSENNLLSVHTAEKDSILSLDDYFAPLFRKIRSRTPISRYVDFNQGLDARLIREDNIRRLAEIPIRPLRIAFDSWKYRRVYESAIRLAADHGIRDMSNYLLYNYDEEPIDLYYRLKLNVDLCEELNVSIYSFPMKYHPISDARYFRSRKYMGEHWNRKYIRAVQAILNSTKGKVGKGKDFFEEAFGSNEEEFQKLLYMPEAMIIYRMHFKMNGVTSEWWQALSSLPQDKLAIARAIIRNNEFENLESLSDDPEILSVLRYYAVRRREVKAAVEQDRRRSDL